jgi:very-short-patch-repair endonuclease
MNDHVTIEATVVEKTSFSMQQNAIPVIREVAVVNESDQQLNDIDLHIESSPVFFTQSKLRIASLLPHQRYRLQTVELELDAGLLSRLTEAEKGSLIFSLAKGTDEIAQLNVPIELMARCQWGGVGFFPEIAAAFVQPNDPAVGRLLGKAIDILQFNGKPPSLVGYQRGKKGVWEQLAALWNAVCNQRIGYVLPPASFEENGQKIRPPLEILETRVGTCLDLTMLFASCMEQCGLNPILVFTKGHAFAGCWLNDETYSMAIVDDVTALRKRVHLQELLLFETTLAAQQKDGVPSFSWACERGTANIPEDKEHDFHLALDVRRARMQRILPLSLAAGIRPKDEEKQPVSVVTELTFEEAPDFVVDLTPPEDVSPKGPLSRLERWQRKLLDLSLRNNLLNHRATKRVIEFIAPDPSGFEDRLAEGYKFKVHSCIGQGGDPRQYALHEERHQEDLLAGLAREALDRNQLLVNLPLQELNSRLLELYRSARSAMEEGGANTLFLCLGFLSWRREVKDKPCKAPLVLIPVKLERKSVQSGFSLSLHDDEARFNLTLLEMLRKDFAITALDSFEEKLPADEHGLDIEAIWRTVRQATKDIPGWEVSSAVCLSLFSFAKYLMWKDLVDRTETLKHNPVVRHLLDTPNEIFRDDTAFIHPREIDNKVLPRDVYCPLPVDSSQLSAVLTAAQGKDFVLIGPPGTGKSQTIANMIAQCLAEGKQVLFVAEKTAALNVVYRRLKAIGLGEFCLELHSHKARKDEVLQQLKAAYQASEESVGSRWGAENERMGNLQQRLNEYVEALHKRYPNDLTPFLAMGVIVGRADVPLIRFAWASPNVHDQAGVERLREAASKVGLHGTTGRALGDSALAHVGRCDWSPAWADGLIDAAQELSGAARNLGGILKNLVALTKLPNVPFDEKGREGFERLSKVLPEAAGRNWSFVLRPDAIALLNRLKAGSEVIEECRRHTAALPQPYRPEAFSLDHQGLLSIWRLAAAPWLGRLQEALDMYRRYSELGQTLSVQYGPGVHALDYAELTRKLNQASESWWLKRNSLQKAVSKSLHAHAKDGSCQPDCKGDIATLVRMREVQAALDGISPLGEEAASLWQGAHNQSVAKVEAFRNALRIALPLGLDVVGTPVSLQGVLEKLFGVRVNVPAHSGGASEGVTPPANLVESLKGSVVRALRGVSGDGGVGLPDCERDLSALAALRVGLDQLEGLAELEEATGGFWGGINSDTREFPLVAAFHDGLREAIMSFAVDPETLTSLQAALAHLLGPGNVLLGTTGSLGQAMASCVAESARFSAARDDFSQKAQLLETGWLTEELSAIGLACQDLVNRHSQIKDWCDWQRVRIEAVGLGLSPLVDAVLAGIIEPHLATDAFHVNYCRWWLAAVVEDLRVLRTFVDLEREHDIHEFQNLEERLRNLAQQCIRLRLRSGAFDEAGEEKREWGVLKREMEKKKRHMPVRRLMADIPNIIGRLTPCLLMSPLSIAQYLAPETTLFDLIIFDEASQIPAWDAIGAMARGKHVVVVGDPKQLPPTNFFARAEDESLDDSISSEPDMESILDECLGSGLPPLNLRWHYRSRHESLIAFSNQRYYENGLLTFPGPHPEDRAVSCHNVSGTYLRGGSRTNPEEAKALVRHLIERMQSPFAAEHELSFGVVTFNTEQQRLIEDLLENERRRNNRIDHFFGEGVSEPTFVKNLESVQGDERDIIYFSTTFGPDQIGRVSMNFGPLNKDGGERRLNVAVTRARHGLHVFSSLTPDQIDTSKTSALGVHDLRLFLEFAQKGAKAFMAEIQGPRGDFESPFEKAVAEALTQKGWVVLPQVGVSSFRIDLGVVDPDMPGRFLAGVECDGATYHRAATARDRDRLREHVLRGLGWDILRVWSTHWWTSRERAIEKLQDQLTKLLLSAREKRVEEAEKALQAKASCLETLPDADDKPSPSAPHPESRQTGASQRENVQGFSPEVDDSPCDLDEGRIDALLEQVVREEAPIHQDALARMVARALGFAKAGRRIREAVWGRAKLRFPTTMEDVGIFFWETDEGAGQCDSCRPGSDGIPRTVEEVAMPELLALARSIAPKPQDDPVVLMARHLGLKRLRAITRPRLEMAWRKHLASKCNIEGTED